MQLETDLIQMDILESAGLATALSTLDPVTNTRAILSKSGNDYVQAGAYANGFAIEKRSGNQASHVHARHLSRGPLEPDPPIKERSWWQKLFGIDTGPYVHDYTFTLDEVIEIFTAYFDGKDFPSYVTWHEGYH